MLESVLEWIVLINVMFYVDGSVELYYSDGDFFVGYVIIGLVDENGEFMDVGIVGWVIDFVYICCIVSGSI